MWKNMSITKYLLIGILAATIASLIQEVGVAMSGVMVQLGWCAQDDHLCVLVRYIVFAVLLIIFGIILDFIVAQIKKSRRLKQRGINPDSKFPTPKKAANPLFLKAKPRPVEKYVSIEVKNKTKNDFIEYDGFLERAVFLHPDGYEEDITSAINNGETFSWHLGKKNPIRKGKSWLMNIAKIENGNLVFTFDGNEPSRNVVGDYILWIEIVGKSGKDEVSKKGTYIIYYRVTPAHYELNNQMMPIVANTIAIEEYKK